MLDVLPDQLPQKRRLARAARPNDVHMLAAVCRGQPISLRSVIHRPCAEIRDRVASISEKIGVVAAHGSRPNRCSLKAALVSLQSPQENPRRMTASVMIDEPSR